jgi:glycogen synthase
MSPPAPQHILMTADTVGGVWTFAMELCAGLGARGTQITLVTMGRSPDDAQAAEAAALANVRLVPTTYRLEWMQDGADDVIAAGAFLLKLADDIKPDLVHANGYHHAALPFDAPVLLAAHSCVASWWQACKATPLPAAWSRYSGWVRDAVNAADMLVAPSHAYLRTFQDLHGRARHARAIWNGRSARGFRPGPKRNIVLAAGRLWDEAKNIRTLCRAAQGLGVSVALAGETISPDGDAADLGDIQALGRLDPATLAHWMGEAAVFAAPARYEPFGLTILEAALCGCALVLSDIPSLRELWQGAATFVHPDDTAGWRRVLQLLTADRAMAAADGHKARERARHYRGEHMVQAYCDAYGALLAPEKPATGHTALGAAA